TREVEGPLGTRSLQKGYKGFSPRSNSAGEFPTMPSELPTSPGSFDCACSPLRDLHASLRMTDFVCVLSSSWLSSTSLCTPNNSSRTAELFPDLSPPPCGGIFQEIPSTETGVQQLFFPESAFPRQ